MGCQHSKPARQIPKSWMDLFAAMRLTKVDVAKFHKIFNKIDFNSSGSVDLVELLTLLDVERTRFTEHVFTLFDSDGSGKIDFKEFVLTVWNYCTIGPASLDVFTFDLYDADKSGKLSLEEVLNMVAELYGKKHMHEPKVKVMAAELRKLDEDGDGISIQALKVFGKHHQALLYPVFTLQRHMQEKILGMHFWHTASARRVELCKGKYVTMADLLHLHIDEDLYKKVIEDGKNLNQKTQLLIKNTGTAHGRHGNDSSNIGPPPDHGRLGGAPGGPPPQDESHSHSHGPPEGHSGNHSGNFTPPNERGPPSGRGGSHPHEQGPPVHSSHSFGASTHSHHSGGKDALPSHSSGHHSHSSGHHTHSSGHHSHSSGHHSPGHHHHGAVLKSCAGHDNELHHTKKPAHATGHHYSDGKVHAM